MKKLYLAGPLSGWREEVFTELSPFFDVYDPVRHSRQHSQSEYAPDDLNAVKKCEVVLAFQPKDKNNCLGMAVEALIGISKRVFSDLKKAVEFLIKISKR